MLHDRRNYDSIAAGPGRLLHASISHHIPYLDLSYDGRGTVDANARLLNRRRRSALALPVLNRQIYAPAALLLDCLGIIGASLVSGAVYNLAAFGAMGDVSRFATSGLLVAAIFWCVTQIRDKHVPFEVSHTVDRARDALTSWLVSVLIFLFILFVLKTGYRLSRGAVLSFFAFGAVTVVATRLQLPSLFAMLTRSQSLAKRDVMVIGHEGDPALAELCATLRSSAGAEPRVVAFNPACSEAEWLLELENLLTRAFEIAHESGQGEIFVSGKNVAQPRLTEILRHLRILPRTVFLIPDDVTSDCLRLPLSAVGCSVVVEVQKSPLNAFERAAKRAFDIAASAAAILFLSPAFVVIAAIIKLDSPGPVFFRQHRTGYRGRPFKILKFRSMTVLEDGDAVVQARHRDARITRVGNFLRRSSLDEFPQLLNVLKGEMSLVGPRPHAVAHDAYYQKVIPNYTLRQHVKPGISGLAQVSGLRGETPTIDSMSMRVEHDLLYVTRCSLWLDLRIVLRTVFEVFRQTNAY